MSGVESRGKLTSSIIAAMEIKSDASASGSEASSRPTIIPSMTGANFLNDPCIPERFVLSSYPFYGNDEYWNAIIGDGVDLGVQLASLNPPLDYHLILGSSVEYAQGTVMLKELKREGALTVRVYHLYPRDGGERIFTHFYIPWTDMDLPKSEDFDQLYMAYKRKLEHLSQPVTHVHCAGGVGRTGTFVYTRALESHGSVDGLSPVKVLENLRTCRSGLVETMAQREFSIAKSRKYLANFRDRK